MIELKDDNLKQFDQHSSKGNQLKWEKDGYWYKADYTGYEGLAECVISYALTKSTLKNDEYVIYEPEQIKYKRTVINGAKSKNFLEKDLQIITIQRLYQTKYNRNLMQDVWHIQEIQERIKYLVQRVEDLTGLKNFGIYLSKMLTIDALFLNEDRHMHNIAVCLSENETYKLCPFFDHGAGLLADTTVDYPLDNDIFELIKEVKGKTISTDFDDALDIAEKIYGQHIHFNFSKKDIAEYIDSIEYYSPEIKERVKKIVYYQMDKYKYLFE